MLNAIREYFDQRIGVRSAKSASRHSIELATAALLVELVGLDQEINAAERAAVLHAVRGKFHLSADEAEALITLAEAEAREATDYYQFTALINQHFSYGERERIVELMWRVAYADAELSAHEQHVVRKLANLLHVSPKDYIAAKLRARDSGSE